MPTTERDERTLDNAWRAIESLRREIDKCRANEGAIKGIRERTEILEMLAALGVNEEPSHPLNDRTRQKIIAKDRFAHGNFESSVSWYERFWVFAIPACTAAVGASLSYFYSLFHHGNGGSQ